MCHLQNITMDKTKHADYHFTAFLENVKTLYSVLKAINFQESATFCATEQGLKVTVEQNKCVQASAYIPQDNFWEYTINTTDVVEFKVNLSVLTECLNIFGCGEESSVKMYYKCEGSPLILILENKSNDLSALDEFITDCEIKTQQADELMYFKGDDDVTETATLVIKGTQFLSILNDLEKASEVVEMKFSPDHPHISITTLGPQDRSSIEIPKNSDMVHAFTCSEMVYLKYKFSQIRLTMKALALASKVAIKTDSRGLLVVQHMIEREEQSQMFIEFYITPLLDDEED